MADMPTRPMPMLNPQTRQPVTLEDLSELFSKECSRQELNETDRWIEIPEEVREITSKAGKASGASRRRKKQLLGLE